MQNAPRQAPDLSNVHPVMAEALRPLFGFQLPQYPTSPAKLPAGPRPAQRYSYAACPTCSGCGEGQQAGSRCITCGGSGEAR